MVNIISRKPITLPEVKEILSTLDPNEMDQIQRWTYNYALKFSKLPVEKARELKNRLVRECSLTEEEAVEVINVMPSSIEELRAFANGWKKLILTETLEKILKILKGEE